MYCQKCGTENKNDARFCVNCGEVLSNDMSTPEAMNQNQNAPAVKAEAAKPKNKKIAIIVIAIVAGLVVLIASINGIRNAILAKQIADDFASLGDLAEDIFDDIDIGDYEPPTQESIYYYHDTALDIEPEPGVTGGNVSTEGALGSFMNTNDWIVNFSMYSYGSGVFSICDEITVKELLSGFGLGPDEYLKSQYDSVLSYSDSIDATLVDDKTYDNMEIKKLDFSADIERKSNELSSGEKAGCDFIVNELSARDYYVESVDNDFRIAGLRIGQSVSGKTFDEFGSPTGVIVQRENENIYYEYAQDAFDNSIDGDTIIVYYLSEPAEVSNWGMQDYYMASFQISAKTKKIKSMKLAYVESSGFLMFF